MNDREMLEYLAGEGSDHVCVECNRVHPEPHDLCCTLNAYLHPKPEPPVEPELPEPPVEPELPETWHGLKVLEVYRIDDRSCFDTPRPICWRVCDAAQSPNFAGCLYGTPDGTAWGYITGTSRGYDSLLWRPSLAAVWARRLVTASGFEWYLCLPSDDGATLCPLKVILWRET